MLKRASVQAILWPLEFILFLGFLFPCLSAQANDLDLCHQTLSHKGTSAPSLEKGDKQRADSDTLNDTTDSRKELERLQSLSVAEAWHETQSHFSAIQSLFVGEGLDPLFFNLMAGALSQEFVWINGGSGAAKTAIAKVFYKNLILGLPYEEKRNFHIQLNKLMTEHIITGNPKINSMLKGLYERNYDQSLAHYSYRTFILDEVEKSHPGLQTSLFSLLEERKLMGGASEVKAGIETGALTSNKTPGQVMQSFEADAPTGEALFDRMAFKTHTPNKQLDSASRLEMYKRIQKQKLDAALPLPIAPLRKLIDRVEIPESLLTDFAQIGNELDPYTITKKETTQEAAYDTGSEAPPYFPANQLSNRSWKKMSKTIKASFLTEQLIDGVDYKNLRFRMNRSDLHHFATSALYNGPGRIQTRFIQAPPIFIFLSLAEMKWFNVSWYVSKKIVVLKSTVGANTLRFKINADENSYTLLNHNLETGNDINDINLAHVTGQLNLSLQQARSDSANGETLRHPVGFDVDPAFSNYLSLPNLPHATRAEIESIVEDHKTLTRILNNQLNKPVFSPITLSQLKKERLQNLQKARQNRKDFLQLLKTADANGEPHLDPKALWPMTQSTVQEIIATFPEMKHVIKSVLLTMVTDKNVFLFGPPGGAKTAITKALIDAELRTINKAGVTRFIQAFLKKYEGEHPEEFKLFMLQCHQFLPEGQIIGFQNIDAQLEKEGKLEWNTADSLAGRVFLHGIIDETEKAPAAAGATLLALMEEREVPYGSVTIPATILSLALTSNKTPPEYLETFDRKDLPTGVAMMDRASIKTYVPNKFADEKRLIEYLGKMEAGLKPVIHGPLAIHYLKPLVDKARDLMLFGDPANFKQANDTIPTFALDIAQIFDTEQLKKEEDSEKAHRMQESPHYYLKANSGSNRSIESLLDLLVASKIVDQLMEGVAFDDIDYELNLNDMGLIADGLIYSGPYQFIPRTDVEGFIYFELDTSTLDQLITSGRFDARNIHTLTFIKDEAETLKDIINSVLSSNQMAHRELVQKHPEYLGNWESLSIEGRDL